MKVKIERDTPRGALGHAAIAAGLLFLLSFVFINAILPLATNKADIRVTPDVKGVTFCQAIEGLANKDLGYEVIDSSYNAELPPYTVLSQYPKPLATVKVGRKIKLKLNAVNPPMVNYPDLTGSTFEFARRQLEALDLIVGAVTYRPDIAKNSILESRIDGEKIHSGKPVRKGSKVHLIVGGETLKFVLPDFSGMPFDDAEAYILGMALKVNELHAVINDDEAPNTVQKQRPAPGDTVRHGDAIDLWVIGLTKIK